MLAFALATACSVQPVDPLGNADGRPYAHGGHPRGFGDLAGVDRPPTPIVDGFALTISKPSSGTVEVSWASQGVSTYEVWTSTDPYFAPGDSGSSMVQSSSALSYSTSDGTEAYYRVFASGAAEEFSTTVGQLTYDLYTGWTKLGMCLVSDVDQWYEFDADMPSNPDDAVIWDQVAQDWDPFVGTDTVETGEVISVQHVSAPSPSTYTIVGHVPTEPDISITLLEGDNLVTTLPLAMGQVMASDLVEMVAHAERVGVWHPDTQTTEWYPDDGDFTIPPCSDIHVEVSGESEWPPPMLPPDPSEVAPPLDTTVTTRFADAVEFLYMGTNPIQTGVAPEDIEPYRAAVIRGRVLDEAGVALPGATVSIVNHPEFGSTLSRADGWYDLAVNGGGELIVQHALEGRLTVQRVVDAPWQRFSVLDEVVLVERDSAVTVIDFSDPIEVAIGTEVTDSDGPRQPVVMFRQGTTAEMDVPGSGSQVLSSISVRMTEHTVGDLGPERMPGPLPVASAYTYAIDYTIDEALAAGAESVTFDPPAISYTPNFTGFDVGQVIPVGSYDPTRAAWVPERNGLVIEIVSETSAMADLDLDGDGNADPSDYTAAGIDDDEREALADLYDPTDELWRVEVEHFSSWDSNMGWSPPPGAGPPPDDGPPDPQPDPTPNRCRGSILECQGQVMGERLTVAGTPLSLNYRSDRVPGRTAAYSLTLPIIREIPGPLQAITTRLVVAGQLIEDEFPPAEDQIYTITWDGLDAYGRAVQGPTPADLCVGFVYAALYSDIQGTEFAFGYNGNGNLITADRGSTATFWKCYADSAVSGGVVPASAGDSGRALSWVGSYNLGVWDARLGSPALGGWTLSNHHTLAPEAAVLYLGDGGRRDGAETYSAVIQTHGGGGTTDDLDIPAGQAEISSPQAIAAAADGSLYISQTGRVLLIDPDGILRAFAGTGTPGYSGDGGPATSAQLGSVLRLAVGPDGSVYISEQFNRRIRRVSLDGTIDTIAGTGGATNTGDEGPATSAGLDSPADLAVARDGTIYVAADNRIRRIDPRGTISTYAGGACTNGLPDGKLATDDCFCDAEGIALGPDGSVYFTTNPTCAGGVPATTVYQVGLDNNFHAIAGGGTPVDGVGDGLDPLDARFWQARDVEVSDEGQIYVSDFSGSGGGSYPESGHRIRVINGSGEIRTLAGRGSCSGPDLGDDGPARAACLVRPWGMTLGNDGALYVATGSSASSEHHRVRRVSSAGMGWSDGDVIVASEDHRELYIFSEDGRHEGTVDALTGTTLWTFAYDTEGRLITMTDTYGRATVIERDGNGVAEAIVSPDGVETSLTIGTGGYLEGITNPEGETHEFHYTADGLLDWRRTPLDHQYDYTYDTDGRLILAEDPEGGSKAFAREELGPRDYEVTMTTELGREVTYRVEHALGTQTRTNTRPDGTQTVRVIGPDGVMTYSRPDGTVIVAESVADPRFGMQAPVVASRTVTTPGALEQITTSTRTGTLQTEGDPLSLIALTETRTVNGNTWTWDYDASTATITMTTPEGREVVTTLTASGTADTIERGTLPILDLDYDTAGRIDQMIVGTGGSARVTTFSYDANGFLDEILDPANQSHGFQYDLVGRLEVLTRPDLEEIGYSYDNNGNLATLTQPSQDVHAFSYDTADRLASYDPPVVTGVTAPETDLSYTDDHELNVITRPDGQTITFAYGLTTARLDTITTPRGDHDFTYDGAGRMLQVDDPDGGSLAYTYDGFLTTSETSTGDVAGVVAWTYDDDFRVVTQTVNNTASVSFTYDDDGLLLTAGSTSLTRDAANGRVIDIDVLDAATTVAYDSFGALDGLTTTVDTTTTVFDATYGPRDVLGRIEEINETVAGVSRTVEYTYDDAGRLETVTEGSTLLATYAYDANGNRTSVTTAGGTVYATYDDQDRLATYGDLAYAYSENGELQTITDTITSDVSLLEYDVLGNLRSVELPDTTLIEYVIDARGRRVGKDVDGVFHRAWLYDGSQVVAELDDLGAIVARFVYGSSDTVPDYMVVGSTTYRLVTDHLGSVRLVVDADTGTIVQQLDYDAWGVVVADTNPGFQPFGFAGGIYDPDTGLVRFGARDYDPTVGRWTSKDPSLFSGGENLYAYCVGDPVNLVDRDGRAPQPVPVPEPIPPPANGGSYPPPAPNGGANGGRYPGRAPLAGCLAHPILCGLAVGFCLGCPSCCGLPESEPDPWGQVCEMPEPAANGPLYPLEPPQISPLPPLDPDDPVDGCWARYIKQAGYCGDYYTEDHAYERCMDNAWKNYMRCQNGLTPLPLNR